MRTFRALNCVVVAVLGLVAGLPAGMSQAKAPVSGPDLVLSEIADLTIRAGTSARVPVSVRNRGDAEADGITVAWSAGGPAGITDRDDRCHYQDFLAEVLCFYDVRLAPGATFTTNAPQSVILRMSTTAAGPAEHNYTVRVLDGEVDDSVGELDPHDVEAFVVHVPHTVADSVAIGRRLAGAVGQTLTFRIAFTNNGPADRLRPVGSPFVAVAAIALPTGLRVTRVHRRCAPFVNGTADRRRLGKAHGLRYRCYLLYEQAGSTESFVFTATIVGPAGRAGVAHINGGVQDANPRNNDASIVLKVALADPAPNTDRAIVYLPITG